jgi:hypothetical protein
VHQSRTEPLQELALAEHDLGLVASAPRHVVEAIGRLAELEQVEQQLRAAGEQKAADGEGSRQRERSGDDVYGERAFPSSALVTAKIRSRLMPSAPASAQR